MTIYILDESTINKIAAGEVIVRPANAVKELLENSFDAEASEIKIEVLDSGLKKIKIIDNGSGMARSDAILSFKRHATSKITDSNDLFNINSLGFRGEALASIAEISNLKIITKTKEEKLGTFIEIEAGKIIKTDFVSCNPGTIIEVTDLFFNVPIRKKYLKSNETEFSYILDIVTRYAIINKHVSIKLFHNNKEIINSNKTEFLLNRITNIYGFEVSRNLIEIDLSFENIKISGFISKPQLTRSDKTDQSLFVNKRYIKNEIVENAIYDAYKTLLFINRHPIFILDLIIDPSDIDVNIHPSKSVIRLKNEQGIYNSVFLSVKNAFKKERLIPEENLDNINIEKRDYKLGLYTFSKDSQSVLNTKPEIIQDLDKNRIVPEKKENPFLELKILGQINQTFIIAENKYGLSIIDQHAAEERVNYERFMKELKNNAIKKQKFLETKILEFNPVQFNIAINNREFLEKIGFEIEEFGKNTIKLSTIPVIFERLKSTIFIDIINELFKLSSNSISEEIEERIIRFSCRKSIKAGEELTIIQMKQLLEILGNCEHPYSCPHGRPTIINLSINELEKKFKRTGW
jgi:DNA mismatch repair protein MutL